MKGFKYYYYLVLSKIILWDWYLISYGLCSVFLTVMIFVYLHNNIFDYNVKDSLELILTINGLFAAILVTYFFNRVSFVLDYKKETYKEAEVFSQKITEFRRILKTLTQYYGIWKNDNSTKSLFEHGKYENIDYYDFKYKSISDYKPSNSNLIDELTEDERFKDGAELFLGMISIVYDRNNKRPYYYDELYKNFEKKGIYRLEFIEKCIDIDHVGRVGNWFAEGYDFIRFSGLSKENKQYILDAAKRIDTKYDSAALNNEFLAELCDDMNEHYFKELYNLLQELRKGLSSFSLLIFSILISSLLFGVLLPFFTYFIVTNGIIQLILTEFIISVNFGLLSFFCISLYRLVKKEITWS